MPLNQPYIAPETLLATAKEGLTPETNTDTVTSLSIQIAGNHYKDLPIQPVQYIHANSIGYFEGNVIKYVSRWRAKGGLADLEKAKHYIELLIDLENEKHSK